MTDKIPVAKILIRNNKGEFLAVKDRESGKWEIPGGKIEEDETRFQTAKREVREEINLDISNLKNLTRIEVEDSKHVECWILYTETFSGETEADSVEISEYRWVTGDEFYSLEWKTHAGYDIPVMKRLEEFLD